MLWLLLWLVGLDATTIKILNQCSRTVQIFRAQTGQTACELARLQSGQETSVGIETGNVTFRNSSSGTTTAWISININNQDYFRLETILSYDIGMQIHSDQGQKVSCTSRSCSSSVKMWNEDLDAKTKTVDTEGILTITFCPRGESTNPNCPTNGNGGYGRGWNRQNRRQTRGGSRNGGSRCRNNGTRSSYGYS